MRSYLLHKLFPLFLVFTVMGGCQQFAYWLKLAEKKIVLVQVNEEEETEEGEKDDNETKYFKLEDVFFAGKISVLKAEAIHTEMHLIYKNQAVKVLSPPPELNS